MRTVVIVSRTLSRTLTRFTSKRLDSGYEVASARVDVDSTVRVDAQLQVGSVTQSVESPRENTTVQTEKTDVATIFSNATG